MLLVLVWESKQQNDGPTAHEETMKCPSPLLQVEEVRSVIGNMSRIRTMGRDRVDVLLQSLGSHQSA